MRAFYDSLNQVDIVFLVQKLLLPKNRKNYLIIQWPLIFRCQRYDLQTFKSFDLDEDFLKLT